METVQKFIDEAVKEYNSGKLTPEKLCLIVNYHRRTFESVHENNIKNLNSAFNMLHNTFIKRKGKKILGKLDFECCEHKRKSPNPFYDADDDDES